MNIRENLKAYLDQELSAEDAAMVRDALAGDPELQKEAELMSWISKTLKTATIPQAHATLSQKPHWSRSRKRLAISGVVATCLIAFLVATPLLRKNRLSPNAESATASMPAPASSMPMDAATSDGEVASGFGGGRADMSAEFQKREESEELPTPSNGNVRLGQPDVIKIGSLSMVVDNLQNAVTDATNAAKGLGGFIESNSGNSSETFSSATLMLRVPSQNFETLLSMSRKLGKVTAESVTGQDVTAQIVDLTARIKTMRAEEDQLRALMSRASRIGDLLAIKDRLTQVRTEIETMQASQASLKNQAKYSTLSLQLEQRRQIDRPENTKGWAEDAWTSAVNGLNSVGRFLGQAIITTFVFAPIWLPILLLGWFAVRAINRK